MRPRAKSEMALGRAMDVKRIGVLPLLVIAVGGAKAQHGNRASLHFHPFEHRILFNVAQERGIGGVSVGDFLYRRPHQAAIVARRFQLFRVVEQRHDGDTQMIPGCAEADSRGGFPSC